MAKLPEGRSTLTDEQMIGLTHRLVDTCIDCKGRIEELEAQIKSDALQYLSDTGQMIDRIAELEAKLAKAMDFIEDLTGCEWPYDEEAKRILAELAGGKDE